MACYSLIKKENFWKLDKIDKICISFLFILFTFLFVFYTFSYASEIEKLDVDIVPNLTIGSNGKFVYANSHSVGYVPIKKGYKYTISLPSSFSTPRTIALSNEIPSLNGDLVLLGSVEPGSSFSYSAIHNDYLYFDFSPGNSSDYITVTAEKILSYDYAISELVSNVGYNKIWTVFENSIPYILVVVLFSLGVWFIKHNIIEHSKGRDF